MKFSAAHYTRPPHPAHVWCRPSSGIWSQFLQCETWTRMAPMTRLQSPQKTIKSGWRRRRSLFVLCKMSLDSIWVWQLTQDTMSGITMGQFYCILSPPCSVRRGRNVDWMYTTKLNDWGDIGFVLIACWNTGTKLLFFRLSSNVRKSSSSRIIFMLDVNNIRVSWPRDWSSPSNCQVR